MASELCPKCGALRNHAISTSCREEVGADGEIKKIVTTSYHCGACNSFIRSHDQEETTNGIR
jgi:bacterioferritin-associated ferredoxin